MTSLMDLQPDWSIPLAQASAGQGRAQPDNSFGERNLSDKESNEMSYYNFLLERGLGADAFSKIQYEMSGEFGKEFREWSKTHTEPFDDIIEFWVEQCRDLRDKVRAGGRLPKLS
jgi:hypothetical protein